jgi:hypothetical protein
MSFDTFASSTGMTGFFDSVVAFFSDILQFFTETIPNKINTFFVWLTSYLLYLKFYLMYSSLVFAHEVALSFMDMININEVVNTAIANLPPDLRQAAADMRFFDALSLLIEALITRLIYQTSM